ncbi:AarF/ABC1/UbiB kinase family protein [Enterobacteriaceae bacterium 4M9]|nr:AarF/ABC1/UbiB kinase family protein [Enterobacteriaceae bacterium 4M9]
MLKMMLVTARDRARLSEITAVLVRYGLQDIVRLLGLAQLVNRLSGRREEYEKQTMPERLRQALEELGPTFVKLGQILATRTDLLDPMWTDELEKLHSNATTLPWEALAGRIHAELGDAPENVFAEFYPEPIAAASMAQVYRARLHGGEDVIIKVLRPGLEKTIRADLRLLTFLAESLEEQSETLARYHPRRVVLALATALNHELDLTQEAHNCELVAQNFADQPQVKIPKIYWQWTTPHLLVQEFLPGVTPESPQQLAAEGFDGPTLAREGAKAFMQMVLEHCLYHADPHPGNVMALVGNRVAFIDFGMVGRLSERRRNQLLLMLEALSRRQSDGIVNALIEWSGDEAIDVTRFELAAQNFLDKQGSAPMQLGKALVDLLAMVREFQLSLPSDLTLLFKALITADGVLHRLDPQFDIVATLRPMLTRVLLRRYRPIASRRRMLALGAQALDAGEELPQTLRLMLRRLKQGKLRATLEINNMSHLSRALERSAVTLAIAVVTAAIALGITPWLMASSWRIWGIPVFPVLGLLSCGAGVFLLALRLRR